MKKKLTSVFSGIELHNDLFDIFADAEVEHVYMNRELGQLAIHIVMKNITHPRYMQDLEEKVYIFLGYPEDLTIQVFERFEVGDIELTPLYKKYETALLYEVKQINPICGNVLEKGKTEIIGENLIFHVEKTGYNYIEQYHIGEIIEEIIEKKFGKKIDVMIQLDDANDKVFQEFIRYRDMEQKNLIKERNHMVAEQEEIIVIKEEDIKEKTYENLIYGKKPAIGEIEKIRNFDEDTKYANIDVELISKPDIRELRGGKTLAKFDVTDYTDSITCKIFLEEVEAKVVLDQLKKGNIFRIRGMYKYDDFDKNRLFFINSMENVDVELRIKRKDMAEEKRVELHLHTQMSDMDSVLPAKAAVQQAIKWGHKAIAITNHGVVQSFPDAFHAVHNNEIKILYGVEGYMVDDMKPISHFINGQTFDDTYIVFDIETTGLLAKKNKITEFGAVKIKNGKIIDRFSEFVNPTVPIPQKIQELTKITDDMVKNAPVIEEVLPRFIEFCGDDHPVLVAQNADFDIAFVGHNCDELNIPFEYTYLDTLEIAKRLLPNLKNFKLNTLADALDIRLVQHHRAVYDAETTAEIMITFMQRLKVEENVHTLEELEAYGKRVLPNHKKIYANHIILLAKTREGLRNLYKLISESHIHYFFKKPLMPKSLLEKYKEGIVFGSACESGDLYPAVMEGKRDEVIERIVNYYDYLEIQPTGNNEFMIAKGIIDSIKDIEDTNRKIVELGKKYNKPVVATCDVHFMNPEDEVYRRVLMAGKGFRDADNQPPLYFRTTNEMLEEFAYLGKDVAKEVVITNPNLIADSLDYIEPVEPDKYPPVIPGSEEELSNLCYEKAHEIYGEELPYVVEERLGRELKSIIGNGFAVMYIIAQKLVKKSNDDGYLVGSRGSVGSSFAATMSGITEVNPLAPHYVCPSCKYSDFDSEYVKSFAGSSGVDMEDKKCPKCGDELIKEGHDIPFETFLGFKGNKEPDIDLNFSGEYQAKAHEYTEVLFGEGHVFRAGTIGTLAEKTAYGYVKNYFQEREIEVKEAEVNRIIAGCVGVRRTTGQHPGGIIVLPKDQEINTFTPIQKPANDQTTNIITTHFDYHSIDHNLLKLDILGHDDPTMIRFLEDLTGVNASDIPLDEPKVMSLFTGLEALDVDADDIGGCELGSLGIPEFGTDFVMQMLIETRPKTFSDLIRISGLSHGTDVWTNNAQELIKEGKATISTCISTRDDIMTYLINQGMDKELSFTIMEFTRKGKGLKEEWETAMREANVPEWYIWSCNTIKYMFPKAHAAAYVMMAYRIAYFKVYYPMAYYTAFFSIRASNFDYELMCKGKEAIDYHIKDFKNRFNELTKKEKDMIKDMKIVQEMYARGYDFEHIDIYKVNADRFQIIDGKIMPSLAAINGMGEKAAENIVEARKDGEFISIEDFRTRTKVSKTLIDLLKTNHILDGLPETNQISLF